MTAGDLVRAEIKKGDASERAQALRRIVEEGGLVPDEIMVPLVAEGLPSPSSSSDSSNHGYIVDGFPRTASQAQTLDAMMADRGLGPIQRAVNIMLEDWVRDVLFIYTGSPSWLDGRCLINIHACTHRWPSSSCSGGGSVRGAAKRSTRATSCGTGTTCRHSRRRPRPRYAPSC